MSVAVTRTPPVREHDTPVPAPRAPQAPATPPAPDRPERLVSLDAYRGFIMLAMASAGFGIPAVARELARQGHGSPVWDFFAYQTDHAPWVGC